MCDVVLCVFILTDHRRVTDYGLALHRDVFPVDTHVHRLTKFLGWVPPNATEVTGFYHLDFRIPDEYKYSLHNLLIRHGRSCKKCAGRAETTSPKKVKIELDDEGNAKKAKKMKVVWEGNGLMKERMVEIDTDEEDENDDCIIDHLVNRVRKPRRQSKLKGIKEEEVGSQDEAGKDIDDDNSGPSNAKMTIAIKDETSESPGLNPSIATVAQHRPMVGKKPKRSKVTSKAVSEPLNNLEIFDLASDEDSDYAPRIPRPLKRRPAASKLASKKTKGVTKSKVNATEGGYVSPNFNAFNLPSAGNDVPDLIDDTGSDEPMGDYSPTDHGALSPSGTESTGRKRAQSLQLPAKTSKRVKFDARVKVKQRGVKVEYFIVDKQMLNPNEAENQA